MSSFGGGTGQLGGHGGVIHWHEGLFLLPHHLQALQRQIGESAGRERRLGWAYPYGIIDARLNVDALENMQVRFDRLRAIMPSGLEVDVPEGADLPALDIKRAFQSGASSLAINLAVPLWQAARANTIERGGAEGNLVKRLYRVTEVDRLDENTGENRQPVQLRRINARLVLEGEDTQDMEVMPLARITRATGEDLGRPVQDKSFVPPCLVLAGSGALRNLVRDLGNQVETTRRETVVELTRGGSWNLENLRGMQIEQLLRLRTLNRFAVRLPVLAQAPGVAPLDVYLEMRDLLGDLAALAPDRDPWAAPAYDHDNPAVSFMELDSRIRSLLARAAVSRVIKLKFEPEGQNLVATLEEKHLTLPTEYFLGIKTKQDPVVLARLVQDVDKFKFMPKSMERLRIFGVRLAEERYPPHELPAQPGLHYFRLMRADSKSMWDRISQEKKIALTWPDNEQFEYTEVALYMTVPDEGK